ncbi:MAG: hypothetical protein RR598_06530 [Anaerorhabdus sp.]|uniref:hypothetical protein n=1 Tax=Anaerorhabdus sp. TaxID=1872524 RepID=UPI002FCBA188
MPIAKCKDCEYYTPKDPYSGMCDGSMHPFPVVVRAEDWPCNHFEARDSND